MGGNGIIMDGASWPRGKSTRMRDIWGHVQQTFPALNANDQKGAAGRIGVLGGSARSPGPAYLTAMAALRTGADLATTLCDRRAAPQIAAWGPEVVVVPITPEGMADGPLPREASAEIQQVAEAELEHLDCLVVGVGLGRDPAMLDVARGVIRAARARDIPIILDEDALWLVAQQPDVINGYEKVVLTPNTAEFEQLCSCSSVPVDLQALRWSLGNCTVVQKGKADRISDGTVIITCDEPGSKRRCAGQGHILVGVLATLMIWAHRGDHSQSEAFSPNLIASVGACVLTRRGASLAFSRKHRSMLSIDILEDLANAVEDMFPTDEMICQTPMHSPMP